MQQPSSLIFLAIVVIWAAYLLQHWIRRREALATARSVDQFSDAMRVLERREHRSEGLAEQASDAPNASRPSAPQVSDSGPRPSLRAGTVMTGETQQPATRSTAEHHEAASAPAAAQPTAAAESSVGTMERFGHFAAHAGSPKLRAIALVSSVALLIITVVCAPFGALPWWSPVLMLVVSGGVFWWCRASAMAASAQRPSEGSARGTARRPQAARRPPAARRRGAAEPVKLPKREAEAEAAASPAPLTKATMPDPVVQSAPAPTGEQVFDISAATAEPVAAPATQTPAPTVEQEPVALAAEPELDAEDSWEPVAVPPPTYTMKERAPERPQQAPAPTASKRSYDDVANEDLPFDGLALDQDLDDLPSVFRAG